MNKKILLTLTFLSGITLSLALGISVSPARYELAGDKGKVVYGEFTIINESDTDQIYNTSAENFSAQGETGVPLFTKSDKDVASWIQVQPSVSVTKGEKKTIEFTISIPDNAEAGGHFGAVFLYAKPPEGKESMVSIGTKVGVLILLKVNGEIKLDGIIKDFTASNPRLLSGKATTFFTEIPLTYSYRFTNGGNDRVNPYGVISITNTVGMKTDILSANPSQGNVLPQSTRKFDVIWGIGEKEDVPMGFFSKAFYQAKHFAFGYYTAHLKIAYDVQAKKDVIETSRDIEKNIKTSVKNVEKEVTIFVLPWQLITVTFIFILVLFFSFTKGLKRYNKWIIKQAKLSMQK